MLPPSQSHFVLFVQLLLKLEVSTWCTCTTDGWGQEVRVRESECTSSFVLPLICIEEGLLHMCVSAWCHLGDQLLFILNEGLCRGATGAEAVTTLVTTPLCCIWVQVPESEPAVILRLLVP